MCTVTWRRSAAGFELFGSRDELRTRGPEVPPEVRVRDGVRYVAPLDSQAGGTWIAVNEHGLGVALLNGYRPADLLTPRVPRPSRGGLVLAVIGAPDAEQAWRRLATQRVERYASFEMVLLDPAGGGVLAIWDGEGDLRRYDADAARPRLSSGYAPERVLPNRGALYERLAGAGEPSRRALEAFHASHEGGAGPGSICMHRADAETRSLTTIRVDDALVELVHRAGPPCRPGDVTVARISRRLADEPAV